MRASVFDFVHPLWLFVAACRCNEAPSPDSELLHAVSGPVQPDLERGLRQWWGNTWFGEFQKAIDQDKRDVGYELYRQHFDGASGIIATVMEKVLDKHLSGRPCASLPMNVSLHAWRYSQNGIDSCLNLNATEGASCTLHCKNLPTLSITLTCSETASGLALLGDPPKGACRWLPDDEIINTTGGLVRGLVRPLLWKHANGSVSIEPTRTFWGMRYADRPARFAVSKPLSSRWSGVQEIDYNDVDHNYTMRIFCASGVPTEHIHGTEDCLFLDVYVPPGASPTSLRPVLVWIYAAGFIFGDAWMNGGLDAARLALRQDAVIVISSHRTAGLGHWAHPALTREYGDGSVGNLGERDQRQALRWVQANINAFGGDPLRVTLGGHSSGAMDTLFHIFSPHSHGLFHSAISESASVDSGWYWQSKDQAFRFYAELGEALGCPQDNGSGEQIVCLRALPTGAFQSFSAKQMGAVRDATGIDMSSSWGAIKAMFSVFTEFAPAGLGQYDSPILANPLWPMLCYGLVVDGSDEGLPSPPREIYESGRTANVSIYLNTESDEGSLFAMMVSVVFPWKKSVSVTHAAIDAMMKWAYGGNASFQDTLVSRSYPGEWSRPPFFRLVHAITDSVFKCSNRRFARALANRRPGTVFWAEHTYSQSHSTNVIGALANKDKGWFLGAHHCLPTSGLFGYMFLGGHSYVGGDWDDMAQKDHTIMNCHYALMIHCGDPGGRPGTTACFPGVDLPLACQGLAQDDIFPFEAFNASSGRRHQLSPTEHTPIAPSERELDLCNFWDAAPFMSFHDNNCHKCKNTNGAAGLEPVEFPIVV